MYKTDNGDAVNKVLHDMRAPLVNVEGFAGELGKAVADLSDLIRQFDTTLPTEFHSRASALVEEDLSPCLSLLQSAAKKLDEQIDRFARVLCEEKAGPPRGES